MLLQDTAPSSIGEAAAQFLGFLTLVPAGLNLIASSFVNHVSWVSLKEAAQKGCCALQCSVLGRASNIRRVVEIICIPHKFC